MVVGEILHLVGRLFEILLSMLGLSGISAVDSRLLRVFIKYGGKSVAVNLDPEWSVLQVKENVAPKLGVGADEIKIIFAGNELPDDLILNSCDVGQQSYLHAVRVVHIRDQSQQLVKTMSPSTTLRTRTFSSGDENSLPSLQESDDLNLSEVPIDGSKNLQCNDSNKGQSDFFVFCPECHDLTEGKLRVRCRDCMDGAFTVNDHPSCWEDVMIPNKIKGTCQNESCRGNNSQFFFKCTKHITKGENDSAPPLSLIKRNPEGVPCLACGDVKEIILIFPCALSHSTCLECFKDYLMVKLNRREFVQDETVGYSVGCPALCSNSLIQDSNHFKLVGKQQYDRYQRFAAEECLLQLGGLFCPQPNCGMGIIPEDSNCDKIACLHGCNYVFCRKCLEGWHIGPCRQEGSTPESSNDGCYKSMGYYISEDRAAAAQWGEPSRVALRLSTKPCPNCRVPTEREGGCMHMECTKCKFQWCWVCQTQWTRDCMGNHWFG